MDLTHNKEKDFSVCKVMKLHLSASTLQKSIWLDKSTVKVYTVNKYLANYFKLMTIVDFLELARNNKK